MTEPTPTWGLMLSGNAADFHQRAPWMIIFPGVAISLAVFAFNLFGDSLRDGRPQRSSCEDAAHAHARSRPAAWWWSI